MPRPHALALLAALALILAACGGGATAPFPRLAQTVEDLTVVFEANPSPRLNASEQLIVTLTDAQGQPVDGADVYLDMIMTEMPMGTSRPIAEPQGEGRYLASAAYTMTGVWDIVVVAEVAGKEYKATFKITAVQ